MRENAPTEENRQVCSWRIQNSDKEGSLDHNIAQRAGKHKQGKATKSVAGEEPEGKRQKKRQKNGSPQ